jgi:transglutaminase-like putative cysteine protease
VLPKLFAWLIRRIVPSLALLMIAAGSVIATLSDVVRGLNFELLLVIAMSSIVLAWMLAAAKPVPDWLAAVIITILGSEAIGLYLGGLDDDLVVVGQNLAGLMVQFWQNPLEGLPDPSAAIQALYIFLTGAMTIAARTTTWFVTLFGGLAAFDPVVVTMVWSGAVWSVLAWAAWVIRRHQKPLLAMLPAGALLVITLANTVGPVNNLLVMLGAILLLMGLNEQVLREQRWQVNHIDYAHDLRLDVNVAVIIISISLMTMAWAVPSLSIRDIARFSQRWLQGNLVQAESVASSIGLTRREQAELPLAEFRASNLPRGHLLGSGPELSDQIAMIISVTAPAAKPAAISASEPPPRYYWRSLTYDIYTGIGWRTSATQQIDYEAGQPASSSTGSSGRTFLRQHVETFTPQHGLLYTAGDLITADHAYSVAWRGSTDSFAGTIEAAAYTVDALVPGVGQEQLIAAGTDYPDWMGPRYLRLPPHLPDRVLALARELTATAPTPYDRAKVIETYLRTFPYNLDLPTPPGHRDLVDYFLFDLQQGYCDYYASSMVVLARAAGLPARLVVGYASGQFDRAYNRYIVTEADAHSWPEIYFPEYGWIPFEPTAAQPVNPFSASLETSGIAEPLPPLTPAENPYFIDTVYWLIPAVIILTLVGGGTGSFIVDGWRLRRLPPGHVMAALYQRLRRQARHLTLPVGVGQTPYEFAAILTTHLDARAAESRWRTSLVPARPEVQRLTELYVQGSYSNHPLSPTDRRNAIQIWKRLRWRLWLVSVTGRITQFKHYTSPR